MPGRIGPLEPKTLDLEATPKPSTLARAKRPQTPDPKRREGHVRIWRAIPKHPDQEEDKRSNQGQSRVLHEYFAESFRLPRQAGAVKSQGGTPLRVVEEIWLNPPARRAPENAHPGRRTVECFSSKRSNMVLHGSMVGHGRTDLPRTPQQDTASIRTGHRHLR